MIFRYCVLHSRSTVNNRTSVFALKFKMPTKLKLIPFGPYQIACSEGNISNLFTDLKFFQIWIMWCCKRLYRSHSIEWLNSPTIVLYLTIVFGCIPKIWPPPKRKPKYLSVQVIWCPDAMSQDLYREKFEKIGFFRREFF